jgi:hypothetical protein
MTVLHSNERARAEARGGVFFRYELVPSRRMSYISAGIVEWSARPPFDFLAAPSLFFDMVHPDDRVAFLRSLSGGDAGGGATRIRWTRNDGSSYEVEQRVFPVVDDSGVLVAVEGTAQLSGSPGAKDGDRAGVDH